MHRAHTTIARQYSSTQPQNLCVQTNNHVKHQGTQLWLQRPRRLDKFLCDARVGPRTACRQLCRSGQVRINHHITHEPWTLVFPHCDTVHLHHTKLDLVPPHIYALLHKPSGTISALSNPGERPDLRQVLPPQWHKQTGHVGRLDRLTTGALLITDDGDLQHLLTHPSHDLWKRYIATVDAFVAPDDLRLEALRSGQIHLKQQHTALPARAHLLPKNTAPHTEICIEICEGKKHQIRQMVRAVGLPLHHLHRDAIGPLSLGNLACGDLRLLTPQEIETLYDAAGGRLKLERDIAKTLAKPLHLGKLTSRSATLVTQHLKKLANIPPLSTTLPLQ